MSKSAYANIHVIGLGGTGTNVIQALIESEKFSELLSSEDFSIACLAMDVADGDLNALQASYKNVQTRMEQKGQSVDRLWIKTLNLKFNTPDALFEFMGKYNTYLQRDGVVIPNYKPWIQNSMSIPPLAGGVGRMRSLSKAVYALNYYYYQELNNAASVFKDRVLTSKNQPIVVIVFGLGGGTGSGLVFDFARHLRTKLGNSVPIIGLAILPSGADDLLARGVAPYNALNEAELLFNRTLNDKVAKTFGDAYRNPFTALFFNALDPVYNNKNNLLNAKKELDGALIDMLKIFMNFDLADLLARVGTNNDFGQNWVHNLAYLRIRYPVDDYVNYLHEYLKLSENIGEFMKAKREALLKINSALGSRLSGLRELYRRHLITINSYRPETFETELEDVVNRAGKFDSEFKRQVKGLEDFAVFYNDRWTKVLHAMTFGEDTAEYAVMHQIGKWSESISHLGNSYEQFRKDLPTDMADLEGSITASKFLTSSHIRQIRAYTTFANLIGTALENLTVYVRAKGLADEIAVIYAKDQSKAGKSAASEGETELLPLFKAASYILTRPDTEVKVSDQYIPGIRVVKKNMEDEFKEASASTESTQRLLSQKDTEVTRLTKEMDKIRIDVSGKKKLMHRSLETLQSDVVSLKTQLEVEASDSDRLRQELEQMSQLEKDLEITSSYRKLLSSIVMKSNEINSIMSGITTSYGYYERVVELSEAEQVKIMEKILREEEAVLKGEGILKEIVDRDRFRGIVKSYIRIFSVANYAGLSDAYRSDLMWATVGIPTSLWDAELQGSLSSTLNVFSSVEASKSISIRQLTQIDPWTITFLVILAKARIDQVEKFGSMKSDAEGISKSERPLFRSFLLEQGFQSMDDLLASLQKAAPTAQEVEEKKA